MTASVLELTDVEVTFSDQRRGWRKRSAEVRALAGVSLRIGRGELVALVGESGSGKTSTGNVALRVIDVAAGQVQFAGQEITNLSGRALRKLRHRMQLIFQDPYEALDPRCRVATILEEPLRIHNKNLRKGARRQRSIEALTRVGLVPAETFLRRFPHQLSGGQRQRVAIAASLMLSPELIVADEPVSMLDVSVRADIMRLLASLRDDGVAVLLITHDLPTAARYADTIAVMYLGRIVEIGPAADVTRAPQHPYTQALLNVIPRCDPRLRGQLKVLPSEIPDASQVPTGCRFHPRCPVAEERCSTIDPVLRTAGGTANGHEAACILVGSEPPLPTPAAH